jgi:hypothetical protein
VAVKLVELPLHIATLLPADTVGNALTETVFDAMLTQPLPSVPVTVYVILLDGLAVTVAPVVADKLVAGIQVYVTAPVPVNPVDKPLHIATFDPADTIGKAFTVTIDVTEEEQPEALGTA